MSDRRQPLEDPKEPGMRPGIPIAANEEGLLE